MATATMPRAPVGGGIDDIVKLFGAMGPLFGSGKTTSTSQTNADPATLNQADQLLQQIMQGVDPEQMDLMVQNILERAKQSFGPVAIQSNAAGNRAYSDTVLAQSRNEAMARATAEAAKARLDAVNAANAQASNIVAAKLRATSSTTTRQQTQASPGGKMLGLGLAGASAWKHFGKDIKKILNPTPDNTTFPVQDFGSDAEMSMGSDFGYAAPTDAFDFSEGGSEAFGAFDPGALDLSTDLATIEGIGGGGGGEILGDLPIDSETGGVDSGVNGVDAGINATSAAINAGTYYTNPATGLPYAMPAAIPVDPMTGMPYPMPVPQSPYNALFEAASGAQAVDAFDYYPDFPIDSFSDPTEAILAYSEGAMTASEFVGDLPFDPALEAGEGLGIGFEGFSPFPGFYTLTNYITGGKLGEILHDIPVVGDVMDVAGDVFNSAADFIDNETPCFITTAATNGGETDNGYTLSRLRHFREHHMQTPERHAELVDYHLLAPFIVKRVSESSRADAIWKEIRDRFLSPAVSFYELGMVDKTYQLYKEMVYFARQQVGLANPNGSAT